MLWQTAAFYWYIYLISLCLFILKILRGNMSYHIFVMHTESI